MTEITTKGRGLESGVEVADIAAPAIGTVVPSKMVDILETPIILEGTPAEAVDRSLDRDPREADAAFIRSFTSDPDKITVVSPAILAQFETGPESVVDGPSDGAAGRFSIHGEFAHWSDSSPRAARERDDESLEESMVFNAAGVANRQVGIAA